MSRSSASPDRRGRSRPSAPTSGRASRSPDTPGPGGVRQTRLTARLRRRRLSRSGDVDAAPGGVGERLPATALSRNPTQSLFDLASARALNRTLHSAFEESAIFRIDHYLAKEAVQNLLYFRFANSFLEPIWNRNYVDNVQIIMAESLPSSRQPGATTKPSENGTPAQRTSRPSSPAPRHPRRGSPGTDRAPLVRASAAGSIGRTLTCSL